MKKQETGRSMIEMLGVLAVIGVLSVAGIAGYTTAMRSYRTNEIANAVSTLYVMGLAQNQGNGNQELVYAGNIATNNPSGVTTLKYNADKTITMTISDADDCAMVKAKLGDKITGECANLTVTFGEVSTSTETPTPGTDQQPEEPEEDPCSQCKTGEMEGCVVGENCSGCLEPSNTGGSSGIPCISPSNCTKICSSFCFDDDDTQYESCLSDPW